MYQLLQQNKTQEMKKSTKDNDYRRIKLESDYSGFDFFLIKKPLQCTIRIPQTILLDKNGAPKDWIFNSNKVPHHPILKKRRQNLHTFTILKHLCSKHVPLNQISTLKTIPQLKETVRSILMSKKDAQFMTKKKHIQIRTVDNQVLQINFLQFLQYVGSNKFAQQSFYEKWRMIQERVSVSKLDETYLVQSVRRNHLIESKSSKYISVGTGNKVTQQSDSNDAFKQVSPSKQLEVTQTKTVQGYKFFDTYLNKKFFAAVGQIIECIQKNHKCLVESITTRFVIDHNRQPHLSAIQQIYVKPSSKLFEMRQFSQFIVAGEMKLDNYLRCLQQFIIQNSTRPEINLEEPIYSHRKHLCKGQFCSLEIKSIPHITDRRIKLPLLGGNSNRKMSMGLIESVRKRRGRVIEKLKQNGLIDLNYEFASEDSSQYDQSEDEQLNVKVCQNCFVFYLNVLKYFDLDAFNNLVEKKISIITRSKTLEMSNKPSKQIQPKSNEGQAQNQFRSLKTLQNRMKAIEIEKEKQKQKDKEAKVPVVKRSVSQHSRLRPIQQKNKEQQKQGKPNPTKVKNQSTVQVKSNKLIQAKLKNIGVGQGEKGSSNFPKSLSIKKNVKATNYHQAAEQLIDKLEQLPASNQEQFIYLAKKYYKDNIPPPIDRVYFSSEYQTNLYQFMSNSPIGIAPGNRIKKRPEMTLKRLSELTNYPEIVSRSTFVFDTIICDQKTTFPFCVMSSKMIHNNNQAGKPYQNIVIVNDIFDSYIQYISLAKEILEEVQNTRFILFNYNGQSHTIYDKQADFKPTNFAAVIDKLIYRLSSSPNQLNIIGPGDTIKAIGMGYGGFLLQSYMSFCPSTFQLIQQVLLFNSSPYCTNKYREVFTSLLQLYSVQDSVTEQNSFLFYNKAINSIEIEKEDLQNKSGLNSIRVDGRAFLLKNALRYWDDAILTNFVDYEGRVKLVYSKANILLSKADMERNTIRPNLQRTPLKNRPMIQIEGGHDISAQNYSDLLKQIFQLIQ